MTRLRRSLALPEVRWIIAIFLVAFVVRLAFVAYLHPDPRDGRFDDSAFYDSAARHLAQGKGYVFDPTVFKLADGSPVYPGEHQLTATAVWPPGYPATLAVVYKLTGNSLWAGRLLNVVLAALTAVLVFLIARRLFGLAAGATAGMVLALFPAHIFFSAILLSETLFGFMIALVFTVCLYFVFGRERPNLLVVAGLGALVAFTGFVRGEFMAFGAVIALALLIAYRRRALLPIAALALGAAILIVPWVVRNQVQMDATLLGTTGVGRTAYQGHNPNTNGGPSLEAANELEAPFIGLNRTKFEVESNRAGTREARTWAFDHIRRELQLFPKRLFLLFRTDESGVTWLQSNKPLLSQAGADRLIKLSSFTFFGLIALALASMIYWWRRRDPVIWLLFALIPFYMLMFGVLFVGDPRYHYALYIPLSVFGAVALVEVWKMTAERYRELAGGRSIATPHRRPAA